MAEDIDTEIIAASIRNPIHVTDCALAGADIATVPYKVIVQMTKHPLTDAESRNSRQIIRLCSESNRKKNLHRTGTFRIMEEAASGHLNAE